MDDPIFDPWSVLDDQAPGPPPRAPRWRLTSPAGRPIKPVPPARVAIVPITAPGPEPPELVPDALQVLRDVATDRLQAASRRLRIARHDTWLDDLLDEPARALRFGIAPWPGPLGDSTPRVSALLELQIGTPPGALVRASYSVDLMREGPRDMASVADVKLTAAWIEQVVLDFVRRVLGPRGFEGRPAL